MQGPVYSNSRIIVKPFLEELMEAIVVSFLPACASASGLRGGLGFKFTDGFSWLCHLNLAIMTRVAGALHVYF